MSTRKENESKFLNDQLQEAWELKEPERIIHVFSPHNHCGLAPHQEFVSGLSALERYVRTQLCIDDQASLVACLLVLGAENGGISKEEAEELFKIVVVTNNDYVYLCSKTGAVEPFLHRLNKSIVKFSKLDLQRVLHTYLSEPADSCFKGSYPILYPTSEDGVVLAEQARGF